ncbi:MAG TPA: response regulator [Gemmatimonadales bacterium]|jgi:DNA-binding NtrC family response regulator|nr:response regulator [Gemmatimonadales bacterium]
MTVGVKRRILVVDDDEGTRRSLEILLTKEGYEVVQARNGSEALRAWRDHGGDLVIMDLLMPERGGIETIVELLAYNPAIRIIAMSGGGDTKRFDLLGDAGMLGAVATIKKPFSSAEMMAAVSRALNGPS